MLRCVAARNKDEPRPVDLSRQRSAGDSEADDDTDSSGSSSESEADSDGDDMSTDVLAARAAGVRACVGVPPPAAIVALTAAVVHVQDASGGRSTSAAPGRGRAGALLF